MGGNLRARLLDDIRADAAREGMESRGRQCSHQLANASTLASVAVLVGTEFVGAGAAAGWAIGGLFQLGDC